MLESAFLIFVLFQNIISRFLPSVFSYWDEGLCLLLAVFFFASTKGKINKSDFIYLSLLALMTLIGVAGNLDFGYQKSISAIIRDIVGFSKFPLVFITLYRMSITDKLANKLVKLVSYIKILTYVILALGILSIFFDMGMNQEEIRGAIHPYMFLYTHPTYLTTGLICILCILNSVGEATLKEDIVVLCSVALAMRTKGLAFIAVYVFLKYGSRWVRKLQFLYWPIIVVIIFIVARSKLQLYASFSNSPRESLYIGAFNLIKACFPIGSGFGTFASHISGKYFSQVYNIIYIAGLYDINGQISADIGDAGIPYYLGQFGFLGSIFFIALIYKMIKMSISNLYGTERMPVIYLWFLIAISLPSEAILVNNGFELAFVMAMISLLTKRKSASAKMNVDI